MTINTNPYQENKSAFCSRILADLEQMKYIVNIIKFSSDPGKLEFHLQSLEVYLDKIDEHLISISRLEKK
jgi:hypothetical protein